MPDLTFSRLVSEGTITISGNVISNTVNAPGVVDIQAGTANQAQGFCAIP